MGSKATTTVSTKGQIVLPRVVRERRRWSAGTRLLVEETKDGVLLKPAPALPATEPKDVFGSLPYKGRSVSIEEMDAAVAREAKRRAGRRH
jgi:AbrB family looped-hinge helix DNA binding protein